MKNTISFFVFMLGILMFVSCTSHYEEEINQVMEQQGFPLTRASDSLQDDVDCKVDSRLLAKYLRLSGKSMRQHSVIPLVEDGDTLAYCIQYEDGWDIIAGDKRCAPVMIKAETGICNTSDFDVLGVMEYISELRNSDPVNVNPTWAFISEPEESSGAIMPRGVGGPECFTIGMWRPVDSVLVDEVTQIPHIIKAFWAQNHPWNMFTPYIDGEKSSVGCSVVAAGQIIHHYRKTNPMGVEFPTYAEAGNGSSYYNENNMNALRWSTMALSMMDENCDQTALMLGYLGQKIMNVGYGVGSTVISESGVAAAFAWGKLDYVSYGGYDWSRVYNSLELGSPVCVYTAMRVNPSTQKHVYIIDRFRMEETFYRVIYRWDPEYIVSEQEYYANDPDLFIESASGDDKVLELGRIAYTYWGMNWGYANSSYDNRLYMSRSYTAGEMDNTGTVLTNDYIYPTYWATPIGETGNVQRIFYNFENKLN